MHKSALIVLISLIAYCNKPVSIGCPGCISPSVEITFLDSKTKQKIFPHKVIAVRNATDTAVYIRGQSRDSIFSVEDSTYSVFFGAGIIDISVEDSAYGSSKYPNLRVRQNNSDCHEMIIQCLTIELQKIAAKKKKHDGVIINQTEKLGC